MRAHTFVAVSLRQTRVKVSLRYSLSRHPRVLSTGVLGGVGYILTREESHQRSGAFCR